MNPKASLLCLEFKMNNPNINLKRNSNIIKKYKRLCEHLDIFKL